MLNKKIICNIEIFILVFSILAFNYIISSPNVSAEIITPSGCCVKGNDGSICQEISLSDKNMCDGFILGSSCDTVENCKTGCCYSPEDGLCSLNSPKEQCLNNNGNWSNSPTCNIAQCQLGCCILGDQASITTTRECSIISENFNFEKKFTALDPDGSCNSKTSLSQKGACLTEAKDYSGKNDCKFTTKEQCNGEFKEDFLCTAEDLNTNCNPSKDTTCVDGKDEIYYLDTCGNIANIYDSNKYNDQSYWNKVIDPEDSCSLGSKDCGNCDYASGSRCSEYRQGEDTKTTYGNYVCRDLNCDNGRKHGESWCVTDYDTSKDSSAQVGSRNFVGVCVNGEISIEPCADYNQQVCFEDNSNGFSEAQCIVNEWRSCISANEKDSYAEVETECKKYDQCVMFLDIAGNEKYKGLPGFKNSILNEDQGKAGDIGKDTNTVLAHCVPKYTPGYVFWSVSNTKTATQQSYTGLDSGGNLEETKAICSLGSFTCVSHQTMDKSIIGGTTGRDDKENPECNINAFDQSKQKVSELMEALNERCRSLGSCGSQVNVQGEFGSSAGFKIERVKIDANGKLKDNQTIEGYNLTQEYLDSFSERQKSIPMGSIKKLSSLAISLALLITGKVTEALDTSSQQAQADISTRESDYEQQASLTGTVAGSAGALAWMGRNVGTSAAQIGIGSVIPEGGLTISMEVGSFVSYTTPNGQEIIQYTAENIPAGSTITDVNGIVGYASDKGAGVISNKPINPTGQFLTQLGITLVAMALGYAIGKLVLKNSHMTPAEGNNFMNAMMSGASVLGTLGGAAYAGASATAGGGLAGAGAGIANMATAGLSAGGGLAGVGLMAALGAIMFWAAVAYFIYSLFSESTDHQYYIVTFTCEPWSPPEKGDCNLCNEDVRTCSEYRCRSLGLNCQYYTDNGEPGVCGESTEISSARISPWSDILTENLKYTNIGDTKFQIESTDSEKISAYIPINFGIITTDTAVCKIDNKHTDSFDEMAVDMIIDDTDTGCENGKCTNQGTYHKIALSQSLGNSTSAGTLGLVEGENNFYIRCKNFAGNINRAEFAVKIIIDSGRDLTPPLITRFVPISDSYLKQGRNNMSLIFYVNEPSECKYSQNSNNVYEEMPFSASCAIDSQSSYYGEWPCSAALKNLTTGNNNFYFQCKDQPNSENDTYHGEPIRQNINRNSKIYDLNVCKTGLNITSIEPQQSIVIGKSPVKLELITKTSGCIDNGKSICSYKFENFGSSYIDFINTNSNIHKQLFDSLPAGYHNISIKCQDEANNIDTKSIIINVSIDDKSPEVLRAYTFDNKITLFLNEESQCYYNQDSKIKCDFDLENTNLYNLTKMEGTPKIQKTIWQENKEYYIKCMDLYNNTNLNGCAIILKTY